MLRYDLTVTVADRATSALLERSDAVVVRIVAHHALLIVSLLLLYKALLLFLLIDLLQQLSFVFCLCLLPLKDIRSQASIKCGVKMPSLVDPIGHGQVDGVDAGLAKPLLEAGSSGVVQCEVLV